MSTKVMKLKLRCEYSDEDLAERRDELSTVTLTAKAVEDRKADANKAFKEELDMLYVRGHMLAFQIKMRGEVREVECIAELDKPVNGYKRIVRVDTGEFVRDEPMTEDDKQEVLPLTAA